MGNEVKDFDNQILRATVNTILKDILLYKKVKKKEMQSKSHSEEDIENYLNNQHLYFRGESSFHKLRTPSLYLDKYLTETGSEYYYRTLLNELGRDDYQESTSLVRLISELQHYGAKTRMLDITKSPLIALYFAVEKDDKEPGFVFIYSENTRNQKFDTGHTIAIKSALNFMPQKNINEFLDASSLAIDLMSKEDYDEYRNSKNEEIIAFLLKLSKENSNALSIVENYINASTEFMELLNQRARVREFLIYPFKIYEDLNTSHIVMPSKTTERIRQQQGAFIYPKFVSTSKKNLKKIKEEISDSINNLVGNLITNKQNEKSNETIKFSVIKIQGGHKKELRKQLELLGITAGFVYPDIEHQSLSLLEKLNPTEKNND